MPDDWEYFFDPDCANGVCQHAKYAAMGDEKPVSCPVRRRRRIEIIDVDAAGTNQIFDVTFEDHHS